MRMRQRSHYLLAVSVMQLLMLFVASGCFAAGLKTGKSTFWVIWNNGWRFLNFGILVYFLVKWLKDPLASFLKSYRELITKELKEAETAEERAKKEYEEAQRRLQALDDEITRIHELAVKQGEAERDRIIEDAKKHAEGILERARITAYMMVQDAKKKLRDEMVELIIKTAEERISRSINEQDQQRLVERYVKTIASTPKSTIGDIA